MIRHTVLYKLADPTPELRDKTCAILRSMEGNIPLLRSIEVGVDFLHSPRSYDICLQVLLDDRAALDAYQADPYHCDVVKKHMHAVTASSAAIDYEL